MSDWKTRYEANKADVDTLVGRPLGNWGAFKAFFSSDSITDTRKAAIEKVERSNNLYQPGNFIGTTGSGGDTTFYYRSRNNSFGHITQNHGIPENIGRELHDQSHDYGIGNTGPGGKSQEFAHGRVIHTSRNPFVPLVAQPTGWQAREQHAREANPHLKPVANSDVRAAVTERLKK